MIELLSDSDISEYRRQLVSRIPSPRLSKFASVCAVDQLFSIQTADLDGYFVVSINLLEIKIFEHYINLAQIKMRSSLFHLNERILVGRIHSGRLYQVIEYDKFFDRLGIDPIESILTSELVKHD